MTERSQPHSVNSTPLGALRTMNRRSERVSELLREELGQLIVRDLKDPRLSGIVSITVVETTNDLKKARVSVSVMGSPEVQEAAMRGIESASGYMKHELGKRLSLRHVPELSFVLDHSLDQAEYMYQLLDGLGFRGDAGH